MSFDFLNPWMLAGLAGISLPVIAHLLSKKKYNVVQWGAMQFLELGRETRRRVRLEEFLLLLLRILIIALIVLLMARPWASGGMFKHLVSTQPRDVVIVLDSSFSMGWEEGARTPHQRAIDWAQNLLADLGSEDTVALLDVRDQVRGVIEKPTHDLEWVRDELRAIPPPSGSSNLAEACSHAVQVLSETTNLSREIIVLTDGQARCWSTDDASRWLRFDELRQQPAVKPRVWVVNFGSQGPAERRNFSVGPLKLSRELTVTDFPVRIATTIRYTGGTQPVYKRVDFEIDGQPVPDRSVSVQLQPDGETTVEFEHRFSTVGSYVIGVSVDGDSLPGDNSSQAAISVTEAIPVLLVDGDDHLDPTRDETFFARAALSPPRQETPWVRATNVDLSEWHGDRLSDYAAVILANVESLTGEQQEALLWYVKAGGGVLWALGDKCRADGYNGELFRSGLFPAPLKQIARDEAVANPDEASPGVRVDEDSLEMPWLANFRSDRDGTLPDARFESWWELDLSGDGAERDKDRPAPVIAARYTSGPPFLISSDLDRGRILVMTSPLDADWSTLPAKTDYVPLLHEMIFYLSSAGSKRNVAPGVPLLLPVAEDFPRDDFAFYDPQREEHDVRISGTSQRPVAQLTDTLLPGVYSLERKPRGSDPTTREFFVVDFDRGESDLTPLDKIELAFLKKDGRMTFIQTLDELRDGMMTDNSRAELWPWFGFLFLGMLVFEVFMTRRLVRGGHVADDLLDVAHAEEAGSPNDVLEVEDFEDYAASGAGGRGRSVRDSFR